MKTTRKSDQQVGGRFIAPLPGTVNAAANIPPFPARGTRAGIQPPLPSHTAATPPTFSNDGGMHEQQGITPTRFLQQEVEDDNMILYRSRRFFVRTANRPDQRRNPLRKRSGNTSLLGASIIEQVRWLNAEKQRVAEVVTRLLPRTEAINPVQAKEFSFPWWLEAFVVMASLVISIAAQAVNLFNYPLYGQDEGTYISNAWAVLHGMLSPYAYIYDQPPLGWIQIAAWVKLTGGFFAFGNAINSGRVLMLVYASACSLLVYLIAKRLSGSRGAGLLAMILFSLSPLSLIYQHQVLLDNIGTFWLLLSLYLLVCGNSGLRYTVFAAISFGIAILSKEVFLLFLPALLYVVWLHSTKFQRKFAVVVFTYITISLASAFVLMATLKGELFPTGMLPWDSHPHPSLIGTFIQQVTLPPKDGGFPLSWAVWTQLDSPFIFASIGAVVINLIAGWWNRLQWVPAFLALSFWILLLHGGVVFPFYVIPLLPLMALNIAVALNAPLKWVTRRVGFDLVRTLLLFSLIGALVPFNLQLTAPLFSLHPTSAQADALLWIRNNVPHNSVVITDSIFYTDLHEAGGEGVADGTTYPYAHIYWNVAHDPELYNRLLHEDWNAIDYIVADTGMLHDIKTSDSSMLVLNRALHHSILRVEFRADNGGQPVVIQIYQVIHTTKT